MMPADLNGFKGGQELKWVITVAKIYNIFRQKKINSEGKYSLNKLFKFYNFLKR